MKNDKNKEENGPPYVGRSATDKVSSDGLQEADGRLIEGIEVLRCAREVEDMEIITPSDVPEWIEPFIERNTFAGVPIISINPLGATLLAAIDTAEGVGAQSERERVNGLAAKLGDFSWLCFHDGSHALEFGDEAGPHTTDRVGVIDSEVFIEALESAANPDNQGATA